MSLKTLGSKGMSLIEIMVVIMIMGLVAGVTTVYVMGLFKDAKASNTKNQMKGIEEALEHFYRDAGFYPSTEQGLQALIEKPSIGRSPKRYSPEGYMQKIPQDSWSCDFVYYSPGVQGHQYEIYSLGQDCAEGGEGYDADVASFDE